MNKVNWASVLALCLAFALMPIIVFIGNALGLPR